MSELLRPGQAAEILRVNPKTLARWARRGLISSVRLPGGGHRRFDADEIRTLATAVSERRPLRCNDPPPIPGQMSIYDT